MSEFLHVIKRDGSKEIVQFDEIMIRIKGLCTENQLAILDIGAICKCVIDDMFKGITTSQLDELAANICASYGMKHYEYLNLAGRILISNLQKETENDFSSVISLLYNSTDKFEGKKSNLISEKIYNIIMKNKDVLNKAIDYERDFHIAYFGLKTLQQSYLLKIDGKIMERPQHLFMRVSVGIHGEDIDSAIETYNLMSEKWFIHASPTLFNASTSMPQLSSCFLLTMNEDSIDGIFKCLRNCALISKHAGGIGLNVHCIRSTGSPIEGTNGTSNGLIPMLRVFNETARYVDQGGNKRPGAFAIYLEPWHPDILDFLQLRKNHGDENKKARDLFLAMWIPDLFMQRVKEDENWTLMDPKDCPGLEDCWGEKFEQLYAKYEAENRGRSTIKARLIWKHILDSQIETGTPYILYKDACNRKSNQQNLGTIKCSNLCTEIVEYSSPDEIAVCNLASISLPRFVDRKTRTFDYDKLIEVAGVVTKNLNKIIDLNHYPVPETRRSNLRHRPIGIGVQGLADAFALMRYSFESEEACQMNKRIFETIYYGALKMSCELAKTLGPYDSYEGCPVSKGILQPDMWGVECSEHLNWKELRANISKYGLRNSLVTAPMPTASTAQILGNNECFEPYTTNLYLRRVLSGEFVIINEHMMRDLINMGVWSSDLKNAIISNRGSIQSIKGLPDFIKELYKTAWEISPEYIIKMAADRAPFIDQSQSLNLFVGQPTYQTLTKLHITSWKLGLKTGMYYLRTRPSAEAIQFTVDSEKANSFEIEMEKLTIEQQEKLTCSINNRDACTSCSA